MGERTRKRDRGRRLGATRNLLRAERRNETTLHAPLKRSHGFGYASHRADGTIRYVLREDMFYEKKVWAALMETGRPMPRGGLAEAAEAADNTALTRVRQGG